MGPRSGPKPPRLPKGQMEVTDGAWETAQEITKIAAVPKGLAAGG